MTLSEYLEKHDLWDEVRLGEHCNANAVYLRKSDKYPGLVLLHYADEASYARSWNEFNKMCRGAILHLPTCQVIAWPFDKFFNLGEHESSSAERVFPLAKYSGFTTTEKLDGSMLILFRDPNTGENRFTTKGSFDSEHADYANSIMPASLRHLDVRADTLMFELISDKFRNVIDYKKAGYQDGVYLIGARDIRDGRLMSSEWIETLARHLGVPTYKTYHFFTMEETVAWAEKLPANEEGYVIRLDEEQFLVKVKGKDYVYAHRIMKGMNDNAVLDAILDEKDTELITYCPEEYREEVKGRFEVIHKMAKRLFGNINLLYDTVRIHKGDRKEFALAVKATIDPKFAKFMFKKLDGIGDAGLLRMIYQHIKDHYIKEGKCVPFNLL